MRNFLLFSIVVMISAVACGSSSEDQTHEEQADAGSMNMPNQPKLDGGTILDSIMGGVDATSPSDTAKSVDMKMDQVARDIQANIEPTLLERVRKELIAAPLNVFFVIRNHDETGARIGFTTKIPLPYTKSCYESSVPTHIVFAWTGTKWARFYSHLDFNGARRAKQVALVSERDARREDMTGIPITDKNIPAIGESSLLEKWIAENTSTLENAIRTANEESARAFCP